MLRGYYDTGDTIVDNFRVHLEDLEESVNSYQFTPPDKWDWWPTHGFYSDLEKRLIPQDSEELGWGYVSNPAGGFLWFAFAGTSVAREHNFTLYLQIEDATRLTVRLGEWEGNGVRSPLMYEALEHLEESASRTDNFQIKKAGRFHGGESAAVAEVGFEPGDGYLALSDHGRLDMDGTVERLERMRGVVAEVAKRLST